MTINKPTRAILLLTALMLFNSSMYAQKKSNFYIYLCFGQSNMEGQGVIETQDTVKNNRFHVFQALDCPNLGRKKATWYVAQAPNCQCYSKLSPVENFGKTMVENLPDSIHVGIINVAVGGCDIRLFDKDLYRYFDSTYTDEWYTSKVKSYGMNPYKHLIELAQLAQKDGVIKGILLHQGETNTGNPEWVSYVQKIYTNMLIDLSLKAEAVPLLAGEVLSTGANNCCSRMNPIINLLPKTVPTAHIISSADCEGQDIAHFNAKGYRLLGKRYAVKMLTLMGYKVAE